MSALQDKPENFMHSSFELTIIYRLRKKKLLGLKILVKVFYDNESNVPEVALCCL